MTFEYFMKQSPAELFLYLTGNILYHAVQDGDQRTIDSVLSCFEPDARRQLCIGLACLRTMGDTEYRTAIMQAMSSVLYEEMKERKCTT